MSYNTRRMLRSLFSRIVFRFFPVYRLKKSGAKIGKNVFFGQGVYIELENAKLLEIGDNVVLSAFSKIILHDSSLNNVDNFKVLYGKVILGRKSYIGAGAIILPGTKIGENTIIGAGSLVKGTLKKNSVYAGNPAKFLGSISALKLKWKNRKNDLTFLKSKPKWYEQK